MLSVCERRARRCWLQGTWWAVCGGVMSGKRKEPESQAQQRKKRRGDEAGERYVPPPTKRKVGVSFGCEEFQEAESYVENGLRKVRPYYFPFETYCKGRWVGKTLLDVFSSEFRSEPVQYYERAARAGRLSLNREVVRDLGTVLKSNDFMKNTVHRHEPPVTAQPLRIIAEDDELLVVDKPSSLPVHPCGRFRHNTVLFILGKEHNLQGLHTIHRLDRLTSGVLMFAKTLKVSKKMDSLVRGRQVEKQYVCRVTGEFPEERITCEEPILVISYKIGVCRVDTKGKPCKTVFERLSYNGKTSVVKCFPYTGRTHQIRVHLQYLGHPIVNDPVYNTEAWGPNRGKRGEISKSNEELLQSLIEQHKAKQCLDILDIAEEDLHPAMNKKENEGHDPCPTPLSSDGDQFGTKTDNADVGTCDVLGKAPEGDADGKAPEGDADGKAPEGDADGKAPEGDADGKAPEGDADGKAPEEFADGKAPEGDADGKVSGDPEEGRQGLIDPLCGECKIVRPDPSLKDLVMYLHAMRYKGEDFDFSTDLPEWAKEDWEDD